jgi:UDP-N-acetylmuramyl pentapeptide synthase
MAEAARAAGLGQVATAADADEAAEVLERIFAPQPGDLLLVKGSRGIELDRLVAALGIAGTAGAAGIAP